MPSLTSIRFLAESINRFPRNIGFMVIHFSFYNEQKFWRVAFFYGKLVIGRIFSSPTDFVGNIEATNVGIEWIKRIPGSHCKSGEMNKSFYLEKYSDSFEYSRPIVLDLPAN